MYAKSHKIIRYYITQNSIEIKGLFPLNEPRNGAVLLVFFFPAPNECKYIHKRGCSVDAWLFNLNRKGYACYIFFTIPRNRPDFLVFPVCLGLSDCLLMGKTHTRTRTHTHTRAYSIAGVPFAQGGEKKTTKKKLRKMRKCRFLTCFVDSSQVKEKREPSTMTSGPLCERVSEFGMDNPPPSSRFPWRHLHSRQPMRAAVPPRRKQGTPLFGSCLAPR